MGFEKLDYKILDEKKMASKSEGFLKETGTRRTVRDFSTKNVPITIVENCIKAAATAPSGANKQPWHFVIVKDKNIKKEIRKAAEKEEKEFYGHRATHEWLKDLNQFGTNWEKPFLESAPYLIVVFRVKYDLGIGDSKKKNYYVNGGVPDISCFKDDSEKEYKAIIEMKKEGGDRLWKAIVQGLAYCDGTRSKRLIIISQATELKSEMVSKIKPIARAMGVEVDYFQYNYLISLDK